MCTEQKNAVKNVSDVRMQKCAVKRTAAAENVIKFKKRAYLLMRICLFKRELSVDFKC